MPPRIGRAVSLTLSCAPDSAHIRPMAKNPTRKPDRPNRPKSSKTKAGRPEVQPIGPALAELLNPAINRGESGVGSSTGLQPPPDNSWDRRAGGEAAAHRARASTREKSEDMAKRDAAANDPAPIATNDTAFPPPTQPGSTPVAHPYLRKSGEPDLRRGRVREGGSNALRSPGLPPSPTLPRKGGGSTAEQGGGSEAQQAEAPGFDEAPQANYGTSATIPTLDPELARQLGLPTAEDDDEALARPPRSKMESLGVKATAEALETLIREGRPEFKKEDGSLKVWTPHRPPRPEKSEGGVRFEIKSDYEPR